MLELFSSTARRAFKRLTRDRDYKADADIVRRYTDAELTLAQFAAYSDQFTLRKKIGSEKKIHRNPDYYGFGIPLELGSIYVASDILETLAKAGVVFPIEDPEMNSKLFGKLVESIDTSLGKHAWPSIPDPYRTAPRLMAAAHRIRRKRHAEVEGPPL